MGAAYRFLDRWLVEAPIDDVYDVIGDILSYPEWWHDFVIEATGDGGEPRPGKRNQLLVKAFLPYKVRFGLEVIEAERPTRILSRLSGDFTGTGEWRLQQTDGETEAVLDWRPLVQKPLIRYLTPLLRPLFRANHTWAMRRGQEHVVPYMRSGAAS